MRATARHILDATEAEAEIYVVDKVNALEAPLDPAADLIPATWTAEHVGKRIVEAFETLAKTPRLRGPRTPGNSWVPYLYDRGDLNSQEEMSEKEKARRRRARNSTVTRPTAEDLRRLDIVLGWLSELHATDADLCQALQLYASLRATSGHSIKEWARDHGRSHQSLYRQRDKGIAIIGARIAATPVW